MLKKNKTLSHKAAFKVVLCSVIGSLCLRSTCYGNDHELTSWQSLSAQVSFQSEVVNIGEVSIGENEVRTSSLSERTIYFWNSSKNEVTRTVYARPFEYSKMTTGEPLSTYEWKWKTSIAVKQVFLIQKEVKSLFLKLEIHKNDKQLGADYMAELAVLLDQLLEIEAPNVLVLSSTEPLRPENLHKLINDLINDIGNQVIQHRTLKDRFVSDAFWKNLNYMNSGERFLRLTVRPIIFSSHIHEKKTASKIFESMMTKYKTASLSGYYLNYLIKSFRCEALF